MKSTDWTLIENGLQAWAVAAASLNTNKVIWANENGTRPAPDYVSLNVISFLKVGSRDDIRKVDDVYYVSGIRKFTLSVQSYGPGSLGVIQSIQDSLEIPELLNNLQDLDLSVVNIPSIINVSKTLDTQIEKQYSMDIIFSVAQNIEITMSDISGVAIEGTLKSNTTGNRTVDIDIESIEEEN